MSGLEPSSPAFDYRTSHQDVGQASAYDLEFQREATPDGVLWQLEQQILDQVLTEIRPDLRSSLDFACGTGRILSFIEQHVPTTTGVDIAAEMLELAAKRCSKSTLVRGDLTRDPTLLPGPFDLVSAFRFFLRAQESLRHEALAALRARIAPNGWFIANFHRNPSSIRGIYLRARGLLTNERYPFVSISEATRLLRAHGFEPERIYGYGHLFYRSIPKGPARRRRALDSKMWRVPWLRDLGTSFIVVARPR